MPLSRRQAIHLTAAATTTPIAVAALADAFDPPTDRDFIMQAGLTAEEADAWASIADAAGKFFALPEQHPMDRQEVAMAVHVIQNKLLGRPTYRRYLELAKAARGD